MSLESFVLCASLTFTLCVIIKVIKSYRDSKKSDFEKRYPYGEPKVPMTRERARLLILGKIKPNARSSKSGIAVDPDEVALASLRHRYYFGKLFERAAKTEDGKLQMGIDQCIAPITREHGLDAGRQANILRMTIIKEYSIDLDTMRDLEEK